MEQVSKDLIEAYKTLGDYAKKKAYNRELSDCNDALECMLKLRDLGVRHHWDKMEDE